MVHFFIFITQNNPDSPPSTMQIVLVAHGRFTNTPQEREALQKAARIIAADGGAEHVLAAGLLPHLVIGDMDSLAPATQRHLRAYGVPIQVHPRHKDETDLELALGAAADATGITILGAMGGRPDHEWANVLLLAQTHCPARILDGTATIHLLNHQRPSLHLATTPDDTISLIPLADCTGVTLSGLAYPLHNAVLSLGSPRGVSNVARGEKATISLTSGQLLVMHLPHTTFL